MNELVVPEGLGEGFTPWPMQEVLTQTLYTHSMWTLALRREFEDDAQMSGHIEATALVALELASYIRHLPPDDTRLSVFEQFPMEAWNAITDVRADLLDEVAEDTAGQVSEEDLDIIVTLLARLTLSPSSCLCCRDDEERDE